MSKEEGLIGMPGVSGDPLMLPMHSSPFAMLVNDRAIVFKRPGHGREHDMRLRTMR